ncbi:MAG: FKBP-type peptidyl-prolyl cis-trans isomerase [Saprospiraceae bacterium]|nr:FKBP-type peptidyl-prolyl cis-trans isomerase [Saprospiraceae bacterium]
MDTKKMSYGLGVLVGKNLASQVISSDISLEDLNKGVNDALQGAELDMPLEEANRLAQTYLQGIAERAAGKAKEDGLRFLEENAKRDGVVVRNSGLQYEILTEGTGKMPKLTDEVTVHYEGRLLNGKIFDSSYKRNQPATFRPNQLIRGWQEALSIMPAGSKWRLYIPSDIGYGARGAGADIPPHATLVFDLELISVK